MKPKSIFAAGLLSLVAFVASLSAGPAVAAGQEVVTAPTLAHEKTNRPDFAQPLRDRGEVRLIIGMRTAQEMARPVDRSPDVVKAQAVSARQLRVLQRLAGKNIRAVRRLRLHDFISLTVDSNALAAVLADPEVTSVQLDEPRYPVLSDTPGITHANNAWTAGALGTGQVVAVLDTGVDKNHPFLSGKVVAEACFSNPEGTNTSYCPGGVTQSTLDGSGAPCPDYSWICWHGTHVAGIAAGRLGVLSSTGAGMAPEAGLIAIQVFQRGASGITAYDSDILAALDYVYSLRNTYDIASVNLSLGGSLYTQACDASFPSYKAIIDSLAAARIATVIAAGNDGNAGALTAPGCLSNAISVGSTNKQNAISRSRAVTDGSDAR